MSSSSMARDQAPDRDDDEQAALSARIAEERAESDRAAKAVVAAFQERIDKRQALRRSIGIALRQARAELGVTQVGLAGMLGVNDQLVTRAELGMGGYSLESTQRVLDGTLGFLAARKAGQ
jgi:ribosome-binding protein aMBF1 (putative translation factor)